MQAGCVQGTGEGRPWKRQMTGSAEVSLADAAAYDDRSKKYGPGHDPLTGRHAAAFTATQLEL